jgi:hypothetical protein
MFKRFTLILTILLLVSILYIDSQEEINSFKNLESNKPSLFFSINTSQVNIGDEFEIYLNIKDIVDLYGFHLDISYNPNVLEYVGISEGDFCKNDGAETFFDGGTVSSLGFINNIVLTRYGVDYGVNGSGNIVIIKFKAINSGNSDIKIQGYNLLLDPNIVEIMHDNFNASVNVGCSDCLIAHYSFENNADDISGNGNNGGLRGNPEFVSGKSGKALSFDGVDDFVKVLDSGSLSPSEAITIGAWIKTDDPNSYMILRKFDNIAPYPGYAIRKYGPGTRFWAGGNGGDGWLRCRENIQDNEWHYITVSAENNGLKKIYVDGELCSSNNAGDLDLDSSGPLYIGGYGSALFTGLIDEVKIWNYELDEEEVLSEYEK